MNFTEEETNKVNKLPHIQKLCVEALMKCINRVLEGGCNERELIQTMQHIDADNKGYINPSEYYTADDSRKYLNCDNSKFYKLAHKYKIEMIRIKNKPLGYKRSDLDFIITQESLNNNKHFLTSKAKNCQACNMRKKQSLLD